MEYVITYYFQFSNLPLKVIEFYILYSINLENKKKKKSKKRKLATIQTSRDITVDINKILSFNSKKVNQIFYNNLDAANRS